MSVLTSLPLGGVVKATGGPASAALEGIREASGAVRTAGEHHTLQHPPEPTELKNFVHLGVLLYLSL